MKKYVDRRIRTIGVASAQGGAGATHFCLCLSSFLAGVMGYRVCLVSLAGSDDHSFLLNDKMKVLEGKFICNGVVYASRIEKEALVYILKENYDCIILDIGTGYEEFRKEFLSCDLSYVVARLDDIGMHTTRAFFQKHTKDNKYIKYLHIFGSRKNARKILKEFGQYVTSLPFEQDARRLSSKNLLLYRKIIYHK